LQHKRGHAGRDVRFHRDVEDPELPGADEHAVGGERQPRHRGPLQEEHRREEGEAEPQRREHQRREVAERDLDDGEVDAPDGHHRHREKEMLRRRRVVHENSVAARRLAGSGPQAGENGPGR
jgi:hypothetical protein